MGVLGVLRGVGGGDLELLGITCLEYAKTTHCDGDSGVLVVEEVSVMVIWGFWVVVGYYLPLVCPNHPL